MYYVWVEGSCDNSTPSFDEAVEWANEFANDERDDVYIVNENNEEVYRASE